MGSLLSRVRKQPTTIEQLKQIENNLRKIEEYKRNTERKQKTAVATLIAYSAALYVVVCVIVFLFYFPESVLVRLCLLIPLVMVPVIIYWMKRLISKWFQSKMVKANEDYADLQRKKKDIIDSVMETETFNKAKEILAKYAPEKLEKKMVEQPFGQDMKPSTNDLRKRNVASVPAATTNKQLVPVQQSNNRVVMQRPLNNTLGSCAPLPMPQPVFPKERGFADRLVEYMIGDGPSYRYALICRHCKGHNGMALKEEFPYMSYTCCYCKGYNPARNVKPTAPRLPDTPKPAALLARDVYEKKPVQSETPVQQKPNSERATGSGGKAVTSEHEAPRDEDTQEASDVEPLPTYDDYDEAVMQSEAVQNGSEEDLSGSPLTPLTDKLDQREHEELRKRITKEYIPAPGIVPLGLDVGEDYQAESVRSSSDNGAPHYGLEEEQVDSETLDRSQDEEIVLKKEN